MFREGEISMEPYTQISDCICWLIMNRISVFDLEPMDDPDFLMQKILEDKYFFKIYLSKGYWQVPVATEDTYRTSFVIPDGQYEFFNMPFGMMNSGVTIKKVCRRSSRSPICR